MTAFPTQTMDVEHDDELAEPEHTNSMDVEHDDELAVHEPAKDEPTHVALKARRAMPTQHQPQPHPQHPNPNPKLIPSAVCSFPFLSIPNIP